MADGCRNSGRPRAALGSSQPLPRVLSDSHMFQTKSQEQLWMKRHLLVNVRMNVLRTHSGGQQWKK